MAVNYPKYESSNPKILASGSSSTFKGIIKLEVSASNRNVTGHIESFEELAKPHGLGIAEIIDKLREYARENHKSMLELVAEHLLDDLPYSVGNVIRQKVQERHPQTKPEGPKFEGLFASGRTDLSERMEEILYGTEDDDQEDVK